MFNPEKCEFVSMAAAKEQAKQNPLTEVSRASSIVFVTLAEAGQIDDVTATENADQFTNWAPLATYTVGQMRTDPLDGALYRCGQAHTSQEGWNPSLTPAMWAKVGDPSDEWPDWSLPVSTLDLYDTGDQVTHNDKHWTSNIDANVWEPGADGVYTWTEVPT